MGGALRSKRHIAIKYKRRKTMKYVCDVCGYVYEDGELPEDFVCPLCGVGADMFTKEEE